jgi:hypothetical protein
MKYYLELLVTLLAKYQIWLFVNPNIFPSIFSQSYKFYLSLFEYLLKTKKEKGFIWMDQGTQEHY